MAIPDYEQQTALTILYEDLKKQIANAMAALNGASACGLQIQESSVYGSVTSAQEKQFLQDLESWVAGCISGVPAFPD